MSHGEYHSCGEEGDGEDNDGKGDVDREQIQ